MTLFPSDVKYLEYPEMGLITSYSENHTQYSSVVGKLVCNNFLINPKGVPY